ncbi:clavesin-1-like [Centruroides vittatus]|uniref:clavesin-1-like n=1 Tax=Centruroides vittatus TaxID=120091 RepID=UPI0035101ACD
MEAMKEYTWNEKELQEFRTAVLNERLKCKTDDIFLLSFLRARKYDRERALKLLKNYYSARKKYKDIFTDLRPSVLQTYFEMSMMSYKILETGQVIGFGRVSHWDPSKGIHVLNVNKYVRAIVEMALPFLPYKLKQRLHFYGSNMKNLHKTIDPKYIPAEFGGDLFPFDVSETNRQSRYKLSKLPVSQLIFTGRTEDPEHVVEVNRQATVKIKDDDLSSRVNEELTISYMKS